MMMRAAGRRATRVRGHATEPSIRGCVLACLRQQWLGVADRGAVRPIRFDAAPGIKDTAIFPNSPVRAGAGFALEISDFGAWLLSAAQRLRSPPGQRP